MDREVAHSRVHAAIKGDVPRTDKLRNRDSTFHSSCGQEYNL